ncbi:MAG: hypothetical protein Q7T13_05800 [Polaromonas sp.]|nr:hypothetical protein [Polaromonas sp.]
MFSSHLPKVHTVPREYLFAGAGLLLVVGMLVGIAMVAGGQVKKAELRESMLASQRTAMVQCMETLGGAELNKCIIQAQASPDAAGRTTLADNSGSSFSRSTAVSAGSSQGLIPVAFSAHR